MDELSDLAPIIVPPLELESQVRGPHPKTSPAGIKIIYESYVVTDEDIVLYMDALTNKGVGGYFDVLSPLHIRSNSAIFYRRPLRF